MLKRAFGKRGSKIQQFLRENRERPLQWETLAFSIEKVAKQGFSERLSPMPALFVEFLGERNSMFGRFCLFWKSRKVVFGGSLLNMVFLIPALCVRGDECGVLGFPRLPSEENIFKMLYVVFDHF